MSANFSKLATRMRVILPDGPDYDGARRVWNGMIDRRPAAIATCASVDDVIACVRFARDNALPLAVRGGGHSVAGNGTCDDGLVLDLGGMRAVRVNGAKKTAGVDGGATWHDYDRETQNHGVASPGGLVSSTGVGGLTLGGGFGYLSRQWGLASDQLVSADMVTAAGEVFHADKDENPELFWGLRGGGGNFGVVTRFEFRVRSLAGVQGGILAFPFEHARKLLRVYREICAEAPNGLTVYAGLLTMERKLAAFLVSYAGASDDAVLLLARLRAVATPVIDTVKLVQYSLLQQQLDAGYPAGRRNYWKSHYLAGLPDEAIDLYVDAYEKAPSPTSQIIIEQMGGRISTPLYGDTAFDQRNAPFNAMMLSMWPEASPNNAAADEANITWVRKLYADAERFSNGGVYVNYLGEGEQDRIRSAYRTPETWDRLVALKKAFDPDNLFRLNQNIRA